MAQKKIITDDGAVVGLKERNQASNEWTVSLKTGERIDARVAVVELETLRHFLEDDPAAFEAILAFSQGKSPTLGTDTEQEIKAIFFREGEFRAECKAILAAALQKTPDGWMMRNPFTTEADSAKVLAEVELIQELGRNEFFRRLIQSPETKREFGA